MSDGLVHLIREPAGEPDGALVLNHGRGADEHDLYPLLDELDPQRRLLGITTGAPLTNIPPGGRHWYRVPRVGYPDPETFAHSYGLLTEFLDGLLAERGIGWERTAIGGFSMGAVMSYSVALGPGRRSPAALLAFSGFIPTVDGWQPDIPRDTRVFIAHGRLDPVMEVGFARRAHELLSGAGMDVDYHESDAAHHIDPAHVPAARDWVSDTLRSGAARPR